MVVVAVKRMELEGDGGLGWWMIEVVFLMVKVWENLVDRDGCR